MLLIPFDRPIDWRRPPVVTLTVLVLNVLVFLVFQLNDGREMGSIKRYYYESGLARIELPHYRDYLERQGADAFLQRYGDRLDDPDTPWFGRLISDGEFLQRLREEEIIHSGDAVYAQWNSARQEMERRIESTTVWGYGLTPAKADPVTFLTHMFLHGGVFHLIGNMIFLIAVGLLVEVALGSLVMLGLYLLGGLGAAGLFIALNPASVVPLVGASGAIAGLMGLCGALYGLRPIRFFYFIFVYFDYVKAPAVVLLGLWLGKELIEYVRFSDASNVAYMAHVGGLLTGAIAGTALRLGTNAVDEDALDERERTEEYQRRLGEAFERLNSMEPERARPLFLRLERDYPGDWTVLDGLFRAACYAPASEDYHNVVHKILHLDADDAASVDLKLRAFRDYRKRARPRPRIDIETTRRMIDLLLRHGNTEEVTPLIQAALKQRDKFPDIEDRLLRLARKYQRGGDTARARKTLNFIHQKFPGTNAARQAERALTEVSR